MVKITCGLLCCCSMAQAQSLDNSEIMFLDTDWEFTQGGMNQWHTAVVPGTIHQDLIRHHLLPNPFYGLNEEKVQWVENEDWEYRTTFIVNEDHLRRDGVLLTFEGLDTYADVYLNGSLLMRGDNMFVGRSFEVKPLLRKGANHLQIYFHSPIRQVMPQFESNGFNYPADNDHHAKHLSVFTRKAPYSYGWDWGIRMVTSGIWRPVTIRFYDAVTIDDYYVHQASLDDSWAMTWNHLKVNNVFPEAVEVIASIHCSLDGKTFKTSSRTYLLQPGLNELDLPLDIENPRRWMPHGWGDPTLYSFNAEIRFNDRLVAAKTHRIGLRTVRLINTKDAHGESFYFEVNGIPMFAKGANYIPSDALLPAVTRDRYESLFRDIKDANMNLVRVWGGGIYEDDRFYDLADENGILIWQDFMFTCTPYPGDANFLARVEEEADYNIRRLRNHPSLAMWCGNNEILEAIKYWGFQKKFDPEIYEGFFRAYDKLFRDLLPKKVRELDSNRFYLHSSPYAANWGCPESWGIGDSHNWGVWHGKKPFESLDTDIPRFMSEFGFQSFPEMKTIATFASPEDYDIESPVMKNHQKSGVGNALIRTYMERDYIVPERFDDFVYTGLVLQGHGVRHGIEAHRRNRPYCMGTLYWQLNDSWPVVSWSSIDYYGNWKALHYQVKKAFAPIIINPIMQKDTLDVYLVSDRLDTLGGLKLRMELIDFEGKVLTTRKVDPLTLPANSSLCVYRESLGFLLSPEQRKKSFLKLVLADQGDVVVSENVFFFAPTKELLLPQVEVEVKDKIRDGRCELILKADKLVKDLFIEVPIQGARFSDNFFDLLPGEVRTIVICSPQIKKREKVEWTIKHIRKTYH